MYALIGGVDTILGPFLGAVLRALHRSLSRGSTQSSLYIGIVLMLVVYAMPEACSAWAPATTRHKPTVNDDKDKDKPVAKLEPAA